MKAWWQIPIEKPPEPDPPPRIPGKPGRPRIEVFCKTCGVSLGWGHRQHYCMRCMGDLHAGQVRQMQEKKGPHYENWKRRRRQAMIDELIEGGRGDVE